MKRILISLAFLVFWSWLPGQENPCSLAYYHYLGTVGNKHAVADVIIANGWVSGTITFPDTRVADGALKGMIATQRLEGQVDHNGIAGIRAFTGNSKAGEYSGIPGETFKGTFRPADGGLAKSFVFNEEYGDGSFRFNGYCLKKDSLLTDSMEIPKAHFDAMLLLPRDTGLQALKSNILGAMFGRQPGAILPDDSVLAYYSNDFYRKFTEANRDIIASGHSFNWETLIDSYISINTNGILVYRADNYAYTGGAHGIGITRLMVFDTEAMKPLELKEIFESGYEEKLQKLLEQKYRSTYFLEKDQPLSEAGLFEDHIPVSENFWLTSNSIGFYYNPYELAPYAMGAITISLPYNEVLPLMKIDNPVMRLIP